MIVLMNRQQSGLLFILAMLLMMSACSQSADISPEGNAGISPFLEADDNKGYTRAEKIREFRFPEDHGAHPEYRTEWWYFTGNLATEEGRHFGYQLVLFRFALTPGRVSRTSNWATNQVYMAHLALTDVTAQEFKFYERFARNAVGLAGARAEPFHVWLDNWQVKSVNDDSGTWVLQASEENLEIALTLSPGKPIVLQGERGLSRKGPSAGNASYYYSITRIDTKGTITLGEQRHQVTGLSWLDREWSTSALNEDQEGWDWFSLQLTNGYDLMYYQLRRKDGSIEPFSSGTLIDPQGGTTSLRSEDIILEARDFWESPQGGRYPVAWRMQILPAGLDLEITPLLRAQELDTTVRYWEGAVSVQGRQRDEKIAGNGYLEMTGYAR